MFYGTTTEADSYHEARGNTVWATTGNKEQKLTKASDFIDTFRGKFPGSRTEGRSQPREWPRTNAADVYGAPYESDEVPLEIRYATYEAALLLAQGISLTRVPQTSSSGQVTRKKVKAGPVETETEYSSDTSVSTDRPTFQTIDDLLSVVLASGSGGATLELLRV